MNSGRSADLYDLSRVKAFQRALATRQGIELGDALAPWWNPPFYALVFAPLARLPYHTAWLTWMTINAVSALIACTLLCRLLPADVGWKDRGLVPLLLLTSLPFIQSIGHGQNTSTSLLLIATTVTLWQQQRALLAGMVMGLLFFKPQLAAILSIALIITLGRRALLGLAITGTTLLVLNLLALPGTIGQFLRQVPGNLRFMQFERAYVWDRHVTLTAFWRLLLQGHDTGATRPLVTGLAIVLAVIVAGLLLCVLIRVRRSHSHGAAIASTIVATPLLMPFYFDYDLLLLATAGVLFAGRRLSSEFIALARWQTGCWIALYAWLFVNPQIAAWSHVNGAVLIIALLAVVTMISALQQRVTADAAGNRDQEPELPAQLPLAA